MISQRAPRRNSFRESESGTPIFLSGTTTVICTVGSDHIARWTLHSKRGHMLYNRPAICKDIDVLRTAAELGATHVVVWDADTGTSYATELANFWRHGFAVRHGHGNQIGLLLDYWHINGETPKAEQRAAATNKERLALQPTLFEV